MKPSYSVVIPVFNKVEFTKKCIQSLLADTDRPPYELIVVDNASTDDTRSFLEDFARKTDRTKDLLKVIFNEKNLGVAPAWNQGCQAASGQAIAVLNNDIVLTQGWFRSMLWALDFHRAQLLSPFANVGALHYDLEARAQHFTHKNLQKLWGDYDFCAFVMPRTTYEKIGPFDENFKVGGYEDTDYIYRLKKEGLKYGVSGAAFIHHFGSRTLGDFKLQGDKHVGGNRDYFINKWSVDPSARANTLFRKTVRTWRKLKLNWDLM